MSDKCGMKWERCPDDIESGHIEYEALTLCGEWTCSDECYKYWSYCPYCGKEFDYEDPSKPQDSEESKSSQNLAELSLDRDFYFQTDSCPRKQFCQRAFKCTHGHYDENFKEEPVVQPFTPLHVSGSGWRCRVIKE